MDTKTLKTFISPTTQAFLAIAIFASFSFIHTSRTLLWSLSSLLFIPASALIIYFLMPPKFQCRGRSFHLRISRRRRTSPLKSVTDVLALYVILLGCSEFISAKDNATPRATSITLCLIIIYKILFGESPKEVGNRLPNTCSFSIIGVGGKEVVEVLSSKRFQQDLLLSTPPGLTDLKNTDIQFVESDYKFWWFLSPQRISEIRFRTNDSTAKIRSHPPIGWQTNGHRSLKTIHFARFLRAHLQRMRANKEILSDPKMSFYGKYIDATRAVDIAILMWMIACIIGPNLYFST